MVERLTPTLETQTPNSEHQKLFGEVVGAEEKIAALEAAARGSDRTRIAEALQNNQLLEHMIITKGDHGRNLTLVLGSIDMMAAGLGEQFRSLPDARKMEELIRNGGVPPTALVEYCAALYHGKDEERLSRSVEALSQLPDDLLPVVDKAMLMNIHGSQLRRAGDADAALELNRAGMRLLRSAHASGPNAEWVARKLKYGIIVQKSASRGEPFQDTPKKLLDLAEQSEQMGDLFHVGRTYLDVGRELNKLGRVEEAAHYLRLAFQHQEAQGYTSGAIQAATELGKLLAVRYGANNQARRVFGRGIGLGERMQNIVRAELDEMREWKERDMKLPATCLVRLGNEDAFLVEPVAGTENERFMLLTVDQRHKKPQGRSGQKKRGGQGEVRREIAGLLNYTLYSVDQHAARQFPIHLSQRNTEMRFRGNKAFNEYAYQMILPESEGLAVLKEKLRGVDKAAQFGFTILSLSQLQQYKDLFDSRSQNLIERVTSESRRIEI